MWIRENGSLNKQRSIFSFDPLCSNLILAMHSIPSLLRRRRNSIVKFDRANLNTCDTLDPITTNRVVDETRLSKVLLPRENNNLPLHCNTTILSRRSLFHSRMHVLSQNKLSNLFLPRIKGILEFLRLEVVQKRLYLNQRLITSFQRELLQPKI